MASLFSLLCALFLLFNSHTSAAGVVFEDGYTVNTILVGDKLRINPHSVLPLFGSSDFVILDSANSSFYTVSFSQSQDTAIKWLAGNGSGYSDGQLASATFKKPRSFAIDFGGNVYVADGGNLAIRKISKSGVSTIAGGYSEIPGHADGPGRDATFSADFDLAFVPERCALMISDHGHRLIRQINLKPQDCARGSQSVFGASAWAWALALGVSCLVGLIIGFAIRPYITPNKNSNVLRFNGTWKHYLISQGRQVLMFCFDIRSAAVSSKLYSVLRRFTLLILSHLNLMLSINVVESQNLHEKPVSLLDSELFGSKEKTNSHNFAEQLEGLISFKGGVEFPDPGVEIFEQRDENENRNYDVHLLSDGRRSIDNMIKANIMGFAEQAKTAPSEESLISSSCLVKRR